MSSLDCGRSAARTSSIYPVIASISDELHAEITPVGSMLRPEPLHADDGDERIRLGAAVRVRNLSFRASLISRERIAIT
jgi:hypothetical protein